MPYDANSLFNPMTSTERSQDVEAVELHPDPQHWQAEIHQHLLQQVTFPQDARISVELDPVQDDPEGRSANGEVLIDLQGKRLHVPVIIKGAMLYPLDLFFEEGNERELLPLNQASLDAYIVRNLPDFRPAGDKTPAAGLVDEFIRGQGGTSTIAYPPSTSAGGRSKLASDCGMLMDLSHRGLVSQDDIEKTAEVLQSNPELVDRFREMPAMVNEFGEPASFALTKVAVGLASMLEVPEAHYFEPTRILDEDVFQVRRTGPASWSVYVTSDRVYIPRSRDLDAVELRKLFEALAHKIQQARGGAMHHGWYDMLMAKLNECGHVTLRLRGMAGKPKEALVNKAVVREVAEPGYYKVAQVGGIHDQGLVFPKVVDFDGQVLPMQLFISRHGGNYAMQSTIVGHKDESKAVDEKLIHSCMSASGREMSFVFLDGNGEWCATPPFKVLRVERLGETVKVVGEAGLGKILHVRVDTDGAIHSPINDPENTEYPYSYLIPLAHFAMRLSKPIELVDREVNYDKLASFGDAAMVKTEIMKAGDGRYHVKIGSVRMDHVDQADMHLLLATSGATAEHIESWEKRAADGSPVIDRGTLEEPILTMEDVDKLAAEHEASASPSSEVLEFVAHVRKMAEEEDLFKLAAEMPDGMSADAVMAANYLTPENIVTFKSYVPGLKETQQRLAKLLLFSRYTNKLDEAVLKRAVTLLDEIVRGLEGLAEQRLDGEAA